MKSQTNKRNEKEKLQLQVMLQKKTEEIFYISDGV